MIDLDELIATALKSRDRGAENAYRAVQERVNRATMSLRSRQPRPLTQQRLVELVREEIKERNESNEFIGPSNSTYSANKYVISVLTNIIPR